MKNLTLLAGLIVVVLTTGCAHRTVHEECSDEGTRSRYQSYDQCYAEISQERLQKEQRRQAAAQAFSQGFNNGYHASSSSSGPRNCRVTNQYLVTTLGANPQMTCQ